MSITTNAAASPNQPIAASPEIRPRLSLRDREIGASEWSAAVARPQVCLCRKRMPYLAVRRARVGAVDLHAQELLFHPRIQDPFAQRPLDGAPALPLFSAPPPTG